MHSANTFLLLPVNLTALFSSLSCTMSDLPANQKSNQRESIGKKKTLIVEGLLNLILREVMSVVVHVIHVTLRQNGLSGLWIVVVSFGCIE